MLLLLLPNVVERLQRRPRLQLKLSSLGKGNRYRSLTLCVCSLLLLFGFPVSLYRSPKFDFFLLTGRLCARLALALSAVKRQRQFVRLLSDCTGSLLTF